MVGTKLAHYEITSHLGTGGMGEVYQATDSKLGRSVAIKLLPEAFSHDAERVERFQREARVLASLNHPNIAAIYGLEESGGRNFLVMELVEGETLAQRIKRGPIPVDESLGIAAQMAEGLEAAHEKGIIHRDLKPANIKRTRDGKVKLLDFGLAKVFTHGDGDAAASLSSLPTKAAGTVPGIVLGTVAYMSPEQANGAVLDPRTDIFAFGAVFYEMLAGQRAFPGEASGDIFAAVIRAEPDWGKLPAGTPSGIRRLLRRCLQKDRQRRLQTAGDARIEIDEAPNEQFDGNAGPGVLPELKTRHTSISSRAGWFWPGLAAVLTIVVVVALWAPWRTPPVMELTRFQIGPPENNDLGLYLVLSPNGRMVVFTAQGKDGQTRLWIRDLDAVAPRQLPGTEIATSGSPFWSPDSRFVGFSDGYTLRKVDASGTARPITISEVKGTVGQGSWSPEGVIVFGGRQGDNSPIWQVPEVGGEATALTVVDRTRQEVVHALPFFLPDGRHFLYLRAGGAHQGIYIGSLDATPGEQSAQRLLASNSNAVYAASPGSGQPGWLVFMRDGILLTQLFDAGRLRLSGDVIPIADHVGISGGRGLFSVSSNGTLAYRSGPGASEIQLTWFDRQGNALDRAVEPGLTGAPRVSPDGARVAYTRVENAGQASDIWLQELPRGAGTRFTFDRAEDSFPIWSPDGSHIAFRSNRSGVHDLYRKAANGAGGEELMLHSDRVKWPGHWSHDGRYFLYWELDAEGKEDLWVLPLEGARKPFVWLQTASREWNAQFSPDDRWIAYQSDESGKMEVYVRPFAPAGAVAPDDKWQVSNDEGARPLWRKDGKELIYVGANRKLMAVDVTASSTFQAEAPKPLFQIAVGTNLSDIALDPAALRFLLPVAVESGTPAPITVVMNWQRALNR